jgi:hypothetical protein
LCLKVLDKTGDDRHKEYMKLPFIHPDAGIYLVSSP